MRQTVSLLLALLLCSTSSLYAFDAEMSAGHVKIASQSTASIGLNFDLSDVTQSTTQQNGVDRESFLLEDEGFTYVKGMPVLPAVSRLVVVPAEAGLALNFEADTPRRLRATNSPVICDEANLPDPPITALQAGPGGLFPPVVAEMSEPIVIRGVRLVRVTTYPVQYDPASNSYIRHEQIDAEIVFTNDPPVNPAHHPIRRNRSKTFLQFMSGLAINGADVGRDDPDYDREPEYVGHYLIVTAGDLVQWAGEFIEWRRRGGYKVDILVIANNDLQNPANIKTRIRERYNAYLEDGIDPFDFVLLIGDHASYEGTGTVAAGTVLASPQGTPVWGGTFHYDWDYGNMEGNDDYNEVGVSRFIAGNQDAMDLFVTRTLSYERNPYWENTEWFNRAATYSQRWAGNWNVSLNTNARWAKEVMEGAGYTDVRMQENIDQQESQGERVGPFLRDQFNARVAIMAGRAENYYFRSTFVGQGVRANGVYPIDLDVAGHHEWSCWWMLRSRDGNAPVGPVAATTGWGGQWTLPYSVIWMEIVNGMMNRDLPYGWCRLQGLIAPTTYIPNFWGTYPQVTTDVEFYGDPGIVPWVGVPKVVRAQIPDGINTRTRQVEILVTDADRAPVEDAIVTVYAPGTLPAFNHANYPGYDDMQMWTRETNAEGLTSIVFDEGTRFVNNSRVYFTVTGRGIKPFLDTLTVSTPDAALEIGEWSLENEQGNGDGNPNPGELFSLNISARNVGNREDLQGVTALVRSTSPWLVVDEIELNFGDIPSGEEVAAQEQVAIGLSPSCPDGVTRPAQKPTIEVTFICGEDEWVSSIKLDTRAPHFEVFSVVGGNIIPVEATQKDIEIKNIGSMASRPASARLMNAGMGITVVGADGHYDGMAPGRNMRLSNNERFLLSGNRVVVPGWQNPMWLIIETEDGFIDTATFVLQVGQPRASAPQGPDAYGYLCFDDTDTDWDIAPEYEWVEIDPRANDAEFDGTRINFRGQSNQDIGEALGVELPFETQFYGKIFDRISVATNGFLCFGNQDTITNYQNWPMDRSIGGGTGMLAPLWDNLQLGQNGQVYYFYDEEDSRFIVEWSRLRHRAGGNADLTFQVILYDHDVWITETGDQNILFQYKSVSDAQGTVDWHNEVPYASVGISSVEGNTGINYSFNNTRPVTSAPLANQRALLFSTSPRFKAGNLYGRVTDYATGEGIEQAIVFTEHGFIAYTDANGDWRINEALATIPFTVYCHKQGYNDSVYYDLVVEEDDSLEILFDLLHPEFNITDDRLGSFLEEAHEIALPFSLTNTGNGPMDWVAEKRLLGDANANPWELRRSYSISETVDDERIEGVVFADNRFFISGANDNDENLIYILDREGALLDSFNQVGSSRYGYKDMDWDGSYIWAAGEDSIYAFTVAGDIAYRWEDPLRNPNQFVACNREEGIIYLCGTTSDIYRFDMEGNRLEGDIDNLNLRQYGMTYWADDPDGYCLYIVNRPLTNNNLSRITKMDIATGDTVTVAIIAQDSSSTGQMSAFMTNEFDVYSWVFMSVQNVSGGGGGDRLEIHQVDARKDWMDLDVWAGDLDPQETQEFVLTLNSTGLPDTLFRGEVLFRHNADDGEMRLGIELQVGSQPAGVFSLAYPENGDTLTALPLHGDTLHLSAIEFIWNRSIDLNPYDQMMYEFRIGVGEESYSINLSDTVLALSPDTLDLPLWFDRPIWWSVTAHSGGSSTPCAEQFTLHILPNDIDKDKLAIPVEFGLGPVYPNPFNSRTTIRFGIDKASLTSLRMYDVNGRLVANLFDGDATVGYHQIAFDGITMPSGIYWVRLESLGRTRIEKIALIR